MKTFKNNTADLKSYYTLFLETGLIITLILFLAATKIVIRPQQSKELNLISTQESVMMEEILNTKQELKPPSVLRPVVPVEVPNDEIISDEILNFDAELRLDEMLDIPPPPVFNDDAKEEEEEENFFIIVEQMPQLIGGLESLHSHIEYPKLAQRANIQGLVMVQFIITEKGEVVDPIVTRGIGGGCDEEALRVVKNYAKFIPGMQRGVPVRVQYTIPIRFKLVDRAI